MHAESAHKLVEAVSVRVRGVVQGVGFRPFVYRLAQRHGLCGWVLNAEEGVEIHVEGATAHLAAFVEDLEAQPPAAARITSLNVAATGPQGCQDFAIRESTRREVPTVRIAPDLPVCEACKAELFDPDDRRHGYPYITCTNCGPRYSIVTALPYDRPHTTMCDWPLCPACAREYHDPLDRRYHAQSTACPACGPQYVLQAEDRPATRGPEAIAQAARLLREGKVVAVKGLGGYHLACDARNRDAVRALRERKFRKEKPFALMVPDLDTARSFAQVSDDEAILLASTPRPIVLLAGQNETEAGLLPQEVAPENHERGVMLPYTPLHLLLFEQGAPRILVMTSANRSSEPIAYNDNRALEQLDGIADAFLVGERPIARRVDDSVVRIAPQGPMVLRRARGYAPGIVAQFPTTCPVLALGADLKNTITLVVDGQALISQHIGDLAHYDVQTVFEQTIEDLTTMYEVPLEDALIAHDAHSQYRSTALAETLPGTKVAVQHHRAHIASVLAERQAWDQPVVGFAFDGTGYGDDGGIWGGEVFAGSLRGGFTRVAHLYPARLPGGDAAARVPVQAAAGFLAFLPDLPDLIAPPFDFPPRFHTAVQMVEKDIQSFLTTSMGRLFDTVAALAGFTRAMTFEGQAAIWLEHLARTAPEVNPYPFLNLDYRPLLQTVLADRRQGRPVAEIARAFHAGVAREIVRLGGVLARQYDTDTLVVSGGVFQNRLLLETLHRYLKQTGASYRLWINERVPPNDGGVSLGQAALALFHPAPELILRTREDGHEG